LICVDVLTYTLNEFFRYVGRLFVKASGKPQDILPKLRKMAGFSQDEEIELYEEIKFEPNVMCEYIDNRLLFRACQLEDGDIVCFQKSPKPDTADQYRYPDVPSFLVYIRNRQVLEGAPFTNPELYAICYLHFLNFSLQCCSEELFYLFVHV
jgi:ubiquitin carboxyl-terminal hydrolase 7